MADELINLIERVHDRRAIKAIVTGTATEVTNTTCTVTREEAPEIHGVRLNAIDDDLQTYVTIVPKDGTEVLVGIVEGVKTEGVVLRCSEVEKVIWKAGDTTLEFSAAGYTIKRSDESLKKIVADLIDEINRLTVPTSAGPSSTPVNATAFTAIKQRLDNLFAA